MSYPDPRELGARCDLCPFGKERGIVPPSPPWNEDEKPRLVIVGEAPGRVEVRMGAPFLGPSGKLVDRTLEDVGAGSLRRKSHLTNASLCRGDNDKDNEEAAICCAPRLYKELEAIPADVPILALGKSAAKSILGVRSILMTRGFVWQAKEIDEDAVKAAYRKAEKTGDAVDHLKADILAGRAKLAGRVVFPSVHPAFILRSDTWKPILQIDIRRCVDFVEGRLKLSDVPITGPYVVVRKVGETRRALRELGSTVAVDIETDGINPFTSHVLCVGVSDGDKTVVIDWDKDKHARLLSSFLADCKEVVMHNGFGFDQIALIVQGVTFKKENLEDTLTAHHTFASHLPQRLDQVVSEFMPSMPWKITFGRRGAEEKGLAPKDMLKDDLWMYNAGDAWRTARVWKAMRFDLASEQSVYEHDKQIALICQRMQMNGIRMDRAHREFLARKMKNRASALKGRMRKLVKRPDFSPTRTNDIRWALFTKFRAPVLSTVKGSVTKTGLASTASGVLEAFAQQDTRAGRLSRDILHWRGVTKIKATYLDAIELGGDDRARVAWKPFGTVSGRWASRLQSTPRPAVDKLTKKPLIEGRVREVYIPADGFEFVYFDVGQAEMRFAAYLSNDARFIEEMCTHDPYLARARMLFPKAVADGIFDRLNDKGKLDTTAPSYGLANELRQISKIASLARNYLAEAEQVYQKMRADGFEVELGSVKAAFDAIDSNYRTYFRYVERNWEKVRKTGHMRTPLIGRIRWLGFFPMATDVANTPIQSGIADIMNIRLIQMIREIDAAGLSDDIRLVLQVHDACTFECRKGAAVEFCKALIKRTWAEPVVIPVSDVCSVEQRFVLPVDLKYGKQRWSEL